MSLPLSPCGDVSDLYSFLTNFDKKKNTIQIIHLFSANPVTLFNSHFLIQSPPLDATLCLFKPSPLNRQTNRPVASQRATTGRNE